MDDLEGKGRELFSHHGVIQRNPVNEEDDSCSCSGTLSIVEYKSGKCIEWKPTEVSEVSECPEQQDWSLVDVVKPRTRTVSTASVSSNEKMQPLRIPVKDLKSFGTVGDNTRYLEMTLKDGTQRKTFYFQYGNAPSRSFVKAMYSEIPSRRSSRNLYVVLEEEFEKESLTTSFSELNLFSEKPAETVMNYFSNLKNKPYETTMATFSKLADTFLYKQPDHRPPDEMVEFINNGVTSPLINGETDEGYHMVISLPSLPTIVRGSPLTGEQWNNVINVADSIVTDPEEIRKTVFRGGITPGLRPIVWKYLLGYYQWELTYEEQEKLVKHKAEEYFRMKKQWQMMSVAQEERFRAYKERKSLIEKDVNRTDRVHPFFEGDDNPNLQVLNDILMTYVMYNFDLGYVQGMSDLLSPILILLRNEIEAFWCFVGLMERTHRNFEESQEGMKKQLSQLYKLLGVVEPQLADYLEQHDSGNMFFCFRWLLVLLKREFSHNEILRLWDVLFTDLPGPNFHLFVCVAILAGEKENFIKNKFGFNEILRHVNDLSMKINLDEVLCRAEAFYLQLKATCLLPSFAKHILDPTSE